MNASELQIDALERPIATVPAHHFFTDLVMSTMPSAS